jgi:protein phosphatase
VAWRWSQDQYYVADSKGEVVIYRGINQRIAGISLSKPYELTTIPLAQVPSNYQQTVRATDAASSLAEAREIVGNIRSAVNLCKQGYAALQTWVTEENKYQGALALASKLHKKPATSIPKPGPQPPKAGALCPSSEVFGIPPSAIVPAATGRS